MLQLQYAIKQEVTIMNPLEQMNKAMEYIEENLLKEIDFQKMAQIAGYSAYHFLRMFSALAGMPLGEYIRLRKLSVAAVLLQTTNKKIIDIALALGYDSPDAFTKAFQSVHNVLPSQIRKGEKNVKDFLPVTFQLTVKGGLTMDYKIVQKDDFYIVGFKKRIPLQFEGENSNINSLFEKLTPEIIKNLKGLNDQTPNGMLSVSANFEERTKENSKLDQYIGVATAKKPQTAEFDILPVAAATWAVFTTVGEFPKTLQETWAKVYSEWFPSTKYQLNEGPEILWHEKPDLSGGNCKSELWIPVKEK